MPSILEEVESGRGQGDLEQKGMRTKLIQLQRPGVTSYVTLVQSHFLKQLLQFPNQRKYLEPAVLAKESNTACTPQGH